MIAIFFLASSYESKINGDYPDEYHRFSTCLNIYYSKTLTMLLARWASRSNAHLLS
jgi:hypothetical protein